MDGKPPIPEALWNCIPSDAQAALCALWALSEARVAQLEARVRELEGRLNQNSSNSSKPPSTDPPSVKRTPPQPPSGKKPGGQPGHEKHQRALVTPHPIQDCKPSQCRNCCQPLSGEDSEPIRLQVWELPLPQPIVTEYRRHRLTCSCCGVRTCADLPAEVEGQDGPRLQACVSMLTGAYSLSKSQAAQLCTELLGVPMSEGHVCDLEARMGQRLQPVVDAMLQAARKQSGNMDETAMGRKLWLWTFVTQSLTIFTIAANRSRKVVYQLVGSNYQQVLTTDRYKAYRHLSGHRWQICWAHVRRDFQAMIDRADGASKYGQELLFLSDMMFGWWHRVRDGTLSSPALQRRLSDRGWFRREFRCLLQAGAASASARTAGTCRELLSVEESLWTFAFVPSVEPTNNAAERALRHGVLWRKRSHGPKSWQGARYLANIWSVIESCRQQGRSVLAELTRCCQAACTGTKMPSLLATSIPA